VRDQGYALITGASSGIGECFARALAARGRNLVLAARSEDKLEKLAVETRSMHGVLAEVIPVDLSESGAGARLADEIGRRGLQIDLLVNNAAFGAKGDFWTLPLGLQMQMLRLNVDAVVELTYRLLRSMAERRGGGVINVSSTAGFQPVPYTSSYAATKAFITSFSMALREELREYGVRVVTLCPGGTRTNFFVAGNYGTRSLPGGLQPPEEVVAAALRALDRGGGLVVPRTLNQLSVFVQRFLPRALVARIAGNIFRPGPISPSAARGAKRQG
jgi:short-subunit dehydrogenase